MGITGGNTKATGGLGELAEHKQKPMMESYAKFYGCEDDKKVSKLNYTKLQQASRAQGTNMDNMASVPQNMRADPAFKQAQKKFF